MRKYELVKQDNLKDCGVASLETIIKHYKGFVPLEKLREMTKTNKNGTTAYHLIEAAKEIGFEAYGIKCELQDINVNNITLPAIAHVIIDNSYKHFVVIHEIDSKKKTIIIADPADKVKKMTFDDFKKIYQKTLVILFPIKKLETNIKQNNFLKKIKNSYFKHIKIFIIILFLSIAFMFLNIMNLFLLKQLLNKNTSLLFIICSLLILIKEIINFSKNKLIIKLNKKISQSISNEVFSHIIKLPYNFYRNRTTGEVISRFNDLEKVKEFISNLLINISCDLLLIISSSILLLNISKILFLFSILILILYIFNNLIFKKNLFKKIEKIKLTNEKTNSYMIESIEGFETVKGLNLEDNFIQKFSKLYNKHSNNILNYQKTYNIENSIKNIISDIGFLLIIFIGMILINNNLLTIQELFIFNTILSYFIEPIKNIFENSYLYKEAIISIRKINELYYDEFKNINNDPVDNIRFNNLNYSYDDYKNTLENINLRINKTDKIMLIGKSGCGKSTILKLIKKYYENSKVLINNSEEKNKNILYVSQNEFLFTDTLYNNITLGRKIDENKFNEIVKICEIEEIIKDKNLGFNLLIEENGFNISGGEKQRIILARTLLSNFDCLLLDESLSEIDINLERKILKNILKKFKNKTIILVSHRLDNLDLFDKMAKIKNKQLEIIKRREQNV